MCHRQEVINQAIPGPQAKHWLVKMIILVGIQFSKPTRIVQRLDNVFNVSLSDILGSEELHPKHLLYHVPNYLKGVHKAEKHFQVRHLRDFIPEKINPYILF